MSALPQEADRLLTMRELEAHCGLKEDTARSRARRRGILVYDAEGRACIRMTDLPALHAPVTPPDLNRPEVVAARYAHIASHYAEQERRCSADDLARIGDAIYAATGVCLAQLLAKRRETHIVEARIATAVILEDYYGCCPTHIGRLLRRDHSTVVHMLSGRDRATEIVDVALGYLARTAIDPDQLDLTARPALLERHLAQVPSAVQTYVRGSLLAVTRRYEAVQAARGLWLLSSDRQLREGLEVALKLAGLAPYAAQIGRDMARCGYVREERFA